MKHQGLNIPINIIQRTQEQTKHPQFPMSERLPDDEIAKSINCLKSY